MEPPGTHRIFVTSPKPPAPSTSSSPPPADFRSSAMSTLGSAPESACRAGAMSEMIFFRSSEISRRSCCCPSVSFSSISCALPCCPASSSASCDRSSSWLPCIILRISACISSTSAASSASLALESTRWRVATERFNACMCVWIPSMMSANCCLTLELVRYCETYFFLHCFSSSAFASLTISLSFSSVALCATGILDSEASIVCRGGTMASRQSLRRLDFRLFCTTLAPA